MINSMLTTLCIALVVLLVAGMILQRLVRWLERLPKQRNSLFAQTPEQLSVLVEQNIQKAPRWLRVSHEMAQLLDVLIIVGAAASALYALWISSHTWGPLRPDEAEVFSMNHAIWWLSITFLLIIACRPLPRLVFAIAFERWWTKSQPTPWS